MRTRILLLFASILPAIAQEHAPKNEAAFQLGGFASISRSRPAGLRLGPGVALQANYGRRIFERRLLAIYGELHFLASPLREITSNISTATHDVASLYITPGVRVKFAPLGAFSPYAVAGGGVAWYEQSNQQLNGAPNAAPREAVRGALNFGGGADLRIWRWLALRAEIRDFYTGSPAYNIAGIRGAQHNVVAGAAFVLRWGQ
jgi:opacity protein-like surface antigen